MDYKIPKKIIDIIKSDDTLSPEEKKTIILEGFAGYLMGFPVFIKKKHD